ncbi:MAG: hydroxymethylbilane synthase [Rhizobiales bacterium]|nr:hydroxymethylbilane synthase [Hyphomicrobiales bacterium]MBI3671837.1 hydroxymethylbilane synthase [Hyphomicrobiales bacterium]
MPRLKIGTRGSPLALAQARETRDRLIAAHGLAAADVEIVAITTTGDRVRDRPLTEIGGKGLFTKEIEEALLAGDIQLAVHSMKDLPARLPEGLEIAAVLPREDARDAFLSPVAAGIMDLPNGAKVGSSSVRRTAQLLRLRPDLKPLQFRGNVETRLRKLDAGVAQATFLAAAGLNRLGLAEKITALVPMEQMLPAVAQGAIGIEIRSQDAATGALLAAIDHRESAIAVSCERAFLAALDGSCRTPLAGHAWLDSGVLRFRGQALTHDGVHCFEATREGSPADAAGMGREAGEEVKARGGALIAY